MLMMDIKWRPTNIVMVCIATILPPDHHLKTVTNCSHLIDIYN